MKKIFRAILLLFAVLLAVTAYNGLTFQKKVNNRPLPPHYKKGVFHLHSVFSDGLGSIEEICRDARSQNLDFVILTDHGEPNLQSSAATAWNHDTLLIGASEFSLHAGHMAAAGYRIPGYIFPPEPQEAINEVERDGGVTFISHPLDRKIPWTDWQVRGFTGIEIISLYQMAKKNILYGLTIFPLQYLLSHDFALTSLISYPQKELEIWDRFNREGRYYGIYALDSHAKLPIGKKLNFHFPSYGATFKVLRVYVKIDHELEKDAETAAGTIVSALRRGNFFNVIESLAPANGFETSYREKDGRMVEMGGDALAAGGTLIFKLPFDFATDIVVKKDGGIFKTIRANTRRELPMPIAQAGIYRAEISLAAGRFKTLPWIIANPIYIAQPIDETKSPEIAVGIILADRENYFQIEKNNRSSAAMHWDAPGEETPVTGLTFTLQREAPGQADFWVALAHREKLAGANYHGFVFETRGSGQMRFWLQFRTGSGQGEAAYQHSFLVQEKWQKVAIPFSSFHCLYGQPDAPDPAHINAFFFLIDNGNAFPGTHGEIFFRRIGLY